MDREVVELIREDFTTGGEEGSLGQETVAEKLVASSLRSLGAEERKPVERTFLLLGVFPELCNIPMAVLDSLTGRALTRQMILGPGRTVPRWPPRRRPRRRSSESCG